MGLGSGIRDPNPGSEIRDPRLEVKKAPTVRYESKKQKKLEKKNIFLGIMTKRGSGSVIQRYGSADPGSVSKRHGSGTLKMTKRVYGEKTDLWGWSGSRRTCRSGSAAGPHPGRDDSAPPSPRSACPGPASASGTAGGRPRGWLRRRWCRGRRCWAASRRGSTCGAWPRRTRTSGRRAWASPAGL
jgi:hypothetical protein